MNAKAPFALLRSDTCRSCKHYTPVPPEPNASGEEGVCRGAPPQIVAFVMPSAAGPSLNVQTIFPRTPADETCGFHRPRIQTAVQ